MSLVAREGAECLTDFEVTEMYEDIVGVNATLLAPIVDAATEDGKIDPAFEGETAVRMASVYPGMTGGDLARLFIQPVGAPPIKVDEIKVRANQQTPPYILVLAAEFAQYANREIAVFWEVWSGTQRLHVTRELRLRVEAGFEVAHTIDLRSQNYGVVNDKPPASSPPFTRYVRAATWGVEPITYTSSNTQVATPDQQGEVTANGNGTTTISATDSQGQTKRYDLTVEGIVQFVFLSPSATWPGANDACKAAGLELPTARQLTQLIDTYPEHRGSLTDYFGFLPYFFWSSDLIGASTASIVSLDKPMDDDLVPNPSAADLTEHHQVMGVSQG